LVVRRGRPAQEGPTLPGEMERESTIDDSALVARLRSGDEQAFLDVVNRYHQSMVRVAQSYVRTVGAAEDVVQEAWIGVLRGLDGFEGRSSLKTWIFRIVINRAKSRAQADTRVVPLPPDEPTVPGNRFLPADHPQWPGHWADPPEPWGEADARLLDEEALALARQAIARLPPAQRRVITLRDVEGVPAAEVCDLMQLSEGNQRVLLHRARASVRRALDEYVRGDQR
jgi:RNA polymerase sigma-70 factor (ECF subfamily)